MVFKYPEAADLSQTRSREASQGDRISLEICSVPILLDPCVISAGKGLWFYIVSRTKCLVGMGIVLFPSNSVLFELDDFRQKGRILGKSSLCPAYRESCFSIGMCIQGAFAEKARCVFCVVFCFFNLDRSGFKSRLCK